MHTLELEQDQGLALVESRWELECVQEEPLQEDQFEEPIQRDTVKEHVEHCHEQRQCQIHCWLVKRGD